MTNLKTTQEAVRSPITGAEAVRLATTGQNWQASVSTLFNTMGREKLNAARTYYVRQSLGRGTISNASPAVATLASHGLSASSPIVFSLPADKKICTVSIATPAVITRTSHGFAAGDPIAFQTTGALPTGLSAGTTYYVIAAGLATNSLEVSATLNGSAINTSGTQSGVHYVGRVASLPSGVTVGTVYYVLSTGLTASTFQFSATDGGAAVNTTTTQVGQVGFATGNDANDGLTATSPKLTIQSAVTQICDGLDINAQGVTVQCADSTYKDQSTFGQYITNIAAGNYIGGLGTDPINIIGNTSVFGNCTLLGTVFSGYHMVCLGAASIWSIDGFSLSSTSSDNSNSLAADEWGQLKQGAVGVLEFVNVFDCFEAHLHGRLQFEGGTATFLFSGTTQYGSLCEADSTGGFAILQGTYNFVGTCNFDQVWFIANGAQIDVFYTALNGSANVVGQKFINRGGVGGSSSLGTSAGELSNGGTI